MGKMDNTRLFPKKLEWGVVIIIVIFGFFLLGGCATTTKTVRSADGTTTTVETKSFDINVIPGPYVVQGPVYVAPAPCCYSTYTPPPIYYAPNIYHRVWVEPVPMYSAPLVVNFNFHRKKH